MASRALIAGPKPRALGMLQTSGPCSLNAIRPIYPRAHRTTMSSPQRALTTTHPRVRASKQRTIPASYYRGGTSRAPIFNQNDLPADRADWGPIFQSVLGSPDPNGRQLNGLGGGISSLSKICVVGSPTHPVADVDFTFVQLGIRDEEVDYSGNCGNMLAAIGPYAVDEGMVDLKGQEGGMVTVRIWNTNTDKLIEARFDVVDGEASTEGQFAIDGVAGTGAKVELSFLDPAGSKTVGLVPTGSIVDVFDGVRTTCVDAGNPCCFVSAESMGVPGTILPEQMDADPELMRRLDSIRRQASVKMGVSKTLDTAPGAIPKISIVSKSTTHTLLSGDEIGKDKIDLVIRAVSGGNPHRAVPMTVALSVGAAARLEGSVVAEMLADTRADKDGLTIGHASGKTMVAATFDDKGKLEKATVFRTARRIMSGLVYWNKR